MYFKISINRLMDILKHISGYPKIMLNFGYPEFDFWISIIHFWMSKNQCNLGYPKIFFWISKIMLNLGYP